MEKKDQTYFNKNYFENNGQSGDRPALKMYYDVFRRLLQNGKVLEYGAGEGFLSKRLSNTYESYAYDISEYCRKAIRDISPNSKVFDSENEFPENAFNGIITLHTLEHVSSPKSTLSIFNKSLTTDGLLLFVVPDPDGCGYKIKKEKWFGFRDDTHISMLKSSEWKSLLEETGFAILETYSDGFWDVPYLPYIPNFIQKLIFFPLSFLMVLFGILYLPEGFGENLIVIAKKK